MKKFIVFYLLNCFLFNSSIFAHKEWVHQYIVWESYAFLEQELNCSYSSLKNHIGTNVYGFGNDQAPWSSGLVGIGAWREDKEDPVYMYYGISGEYTTSTHFWNADGINGDVDLMPIALLGDVENSWMKAQIYLFGGHEIYIRRHMLDPVFGYLAGAYYRYNSLVEFYNTGQCVLTGVQHYEGGRNYTNIPFIMDVQSRTNIAYGILGRIAHLLADNGCPAHVHEDTHPCAGLIFDPDIYEMYMGGSPMSDCDVAQTNFPAKNWNKYTAHQQGGLLNQILTMNDYDAMRFLFYTQNQLADHFNSELPGDNELSNTTNSYLQDRYAILGGVPPYPYYMPPIADECFNFTIRATATLFDWFARKTNQQQVFLPEIIGLTYNKPDYNLFINTSSDPATEFVCNASGANLSYTWNIRACNHNIISCGDTLPGLTITRNNNILKIENKNFLITYSCPYYNSQFCGNDIMKNAENLDRNDNCLNFTVGLTVSNSFGSVSQDFTVNNVIQPIQPVAGTRPPPNPPGGCPFLFVYNADSSKNIVDNNILHRSENPEFAGQDIEDKYLLTVKPGLINNKFSLGILEPEGDHSYFDNIKLYAIDHSIRQRIVITENNDIAVYDPITVISSESAYRNLSEVTPCVQFDTVYPEFRRLVSGLSNDSVRAEYDSERILSINKKLREQILGDETVIDSLAIIAEIGQNKNDAPVNSHLVKDYAGSMTIDANADSYQKFFSRRENNSPVVIPFSNGFDAANNIDIKWFRNYELVYLSVVDIQYSGFTQTEIPLVTAFHSNEGDMLAKLQTIDHDYAELDSSGYLSFEFSNISPPAPGKIRDYVFVVNGNYTLEGQVYENRQQNNISSDIKQKNLFQNKLFGNYPNPFNPTTLINYEISRASNVKIKIYDVLGKEVITLVNEFKNEGNYQVTFDGRNFSSGIYYYKLETNDFNAIKKMILIK